MNDSSRPAERSTQLAMERTDLALSRTSWAAERTLQAWIRTALSMITFGFTIGKLGQAAQDIVVTSRFFNHEWSIRGLAYTLVSTGTAALLIATLQYWVDMRRLRAAGLDRRPGMPLVVAILLVLLGAFAISALVLQV
jgi:putative membrane protein